MPVSTIEAIILGMIQGLTEFLPVSSSGHLTLAQHLLGFENLDRMIPFDLVCHMGTLFAILIVFKDQIFDLLRGNTQKLAQIAIGTLPLFPILLILKKIESLYDRVELLGAFFLVTALLLWLGVKFGTVKSKEERQKHWMRDPLVIGIFQTLALLPGISRSGSTISSARLLGWKTDDALSFSFLLAIPAILGGTALKTLQLVSGSDSEILPLSWKIYLSGLITSFIFGVIALKILIRVAANQKMMYFVWYCLILGLGSLIYFL
jgi:undecaprenyl-diphosphatase